MAVGTSGGLWIYPHPEKSGSLQMAMAKLAKLPLKMGKDLALFYPIQYPSRPARFFRF